MKSIVRPQNEVQVGMLRNLLYRKKLKNRLFFWFLLLHIGAFSSASALKFNIFLTDNGRGLNTTREIFKEGLENLGHHVNCCSLEEKEDEGNQADINIFIEKINPQWIPSAKLNWLLPNPESYNQYIGFLRGIDLVLCRTHEIERIFKELEKKTYFLGFTSRDCYAENVGKDFSSYLHIRGGSLSKGTEAILEAWQRKQIMPKLTIVAHDRTVSCQHPKITVIQEKLQLPQLRQLQNNCGVLLCTSTTEGFGHHLFEALSAERIVIATDAPPMNEFITDKRCLVPYGKVTRNHLATLYYADSKELTRIIDQLENLSNEELEQIGKTNRTIYLQKTKEFYENLEKLSKNTIEHLKL